MTIPGREAHPTSARRDARPLDLGRYRFTALIFDCDGTLADTAPSHFESLRQALAEQGLVLDRDWYFDRLGLSRIVLFRAYERAFGKTVDVRAAAVASERIYVGSERAIEEIGIVGEVVRRHHGRVPMAVASGGERVLVDKTLLSCGLAGCFDPIVTFDDVGQGKPSPAIFLEAARRLGTAPADCLVFEDSDEGVEAAHRAGMAVIDVRPLIGRA